MHAVVVEFTQHGKQFGAACSGRAGMRRWRTPVATPEGTDREYTASFKGSDPRTSRAVRSICVGIRRSLARGA